jgi:tetratricopeptide (TPR) repeat protein
MLLRRLPVFLLLLTPSVLLGQGQSVPSRRARFSIGGTIRDESAHRALENVLVGLKEATGTPITTTFTRDNGDFQFDGLGNGDYVVEVSVKDYDRAEERVTIAGNSRMGISIFLNRSGKVMNPVAQMSISAHQLSVPHKAHDEFEKGMTLIYLKSDYRGAISQFQLAIRDFPTYYEAYAEEGNCYYQMQEMGTAEEALRKSLELSSGQYADAAFSLAALLTDTKRYSDAETVARQGVSVDVSSWRGPFELARALTALKKADEAEKSAQQSRDLMPDNPPVYLLLANIHIQKKDYPGLMRDLEDYLRLAPTGPEADQARKTRERVQGILNASKNATAETGKEKSQDDDDDDADQAPEKNSPPQPAPDSSGLPSLPPPTPGNQ